MKYTTGNKAADEIPGTETPSLSDEQLDDLWAELAPELSELLQEGGDDNDDIGSKVEIDFSADIDDTQQKFVAKFL